MYTIQYLYLTVLYGLNVSRNLQQHLRQNTGPQQQQQPCPQTRTTQSYAQVPARAPVSQRIQRQEAPAPQTRGSLQHRPPLRSTRVDVSDTDARTRLVWNRALTNAYGIDTYTHARSKRTADGSVQNCIRESGSTSRGVRGPNQTEKMKYGVFPWPVNRERDPRAECPRPTDRGARQPARPATTARAQREDRRSRGGQASPADGQQKERACRDRQRPRAPFSEPGTALLKVIELIARAMT